jgi:hypothetical protein
MLKLHFIKPFSENFYKISDLPSLPETLSIYHYAIKPREKDIYVDICDANKAFIKRFAFCSEPKVEIDFHYQKKPHFFSLRNIFLLFLLEFLTKKIFRRLKFVKHTYDTDGIKIMDGYYVRIINRTSHLKILKTPVFNFKKNVLDVNPKYKLDRTYGYLNANSFNPGEKLEIMVSSKSSLLKCSIINTIYPEVSLYDCLIDNCALQPIEQEAFKNGCSWRLSHTLVVPKEFVSGLYAIVLKDGAEDFRIPFIVKSIDQKKVVIVAATNTWQAYNDWGGASIYHYHVKDGTQRERSHIISFNRPNPHADPLKKTRSAAQDGQLLANAEVPLYKWLTNNNIDFSVISDMDLHKEANFSSNTQLVILSNHTEYWSANMYDGLMKHLKNGGHLLNLSGNAIYWKVVIKDDQMEVRKNHSMHTLIHEPGGNWASLGRPESSILGGSYTLKGWHTYAPYKILDQNHWLLRGTGLKNGDLLGQQGNHFGPASGWECDKRDAFSPPNIELIAKGTNPKNGGAEWMIHQRPEGGWVMTTSSISFNGALEDRIISKILLNYLKKIMLNSLS